MSDELKIATHSAPAVPESNAAPSVPNTYNFHQSGEGTNIGVAQNVNSNTVNLILPAYGSYGTPQPATMYRQTINLDFYNLFVINGETYSSSYFTIDTNRALTVVHGTAQHIHDRLAVFDESAIAELKSYPAVFTSENYRYNYPEKTSEEQYAFYGFVTDIKPLQNGKIKVFFQKMPMCNIPHSLLNQILIELDIQGNDKINEFDKTHWAVKNVNLIEEMKLKGIGLLIPTI